MAWDALLKKSKIDLELLADVDMHLMVEKGTRGGIASIMTRYSKANNKYLNDYNSDEESKYIIYLDANSLYGWAMTKSLPYEKFRWLEQDEISQLDVSNISDDGEIG